MRAIVATAARHGVARLLTHEAGWKMYGPLYRSVAGVKDPEGGIIVVPVPSGEAATS